MCAVTPSMRSRLRVRVHAHTHTHAHAHARARPAGLTPEEAKEKPFIASMGIYVFKKQVLIDLLTEVGSGSCVSMGHALQPGLQQPATLVRYAHS